LRGGRYGSRTDRATKPTPSWRRGRHDGRVAENRERYSRPDLLVGLHLCRGALRAHTLVGPVTWSRARTTRGEIIGQRRRKTSLLRIPRPPSIPFGVAYVLSGRERLGRVDMSSCARGGFACPRPGATVFPATRWCATNDLVVSAATRCWAGGGNSTRTSITTGRSTSESLAPSIWRPPYTKPLSEGELKRILIARALMTDPDCWLLDEPAASRPGGREDRFRVCRFARSLRAGAVLVTHHLEEIPPRFRPACCVRGQVVAAGLLSDVLTVRPSVRGVSGPSIHST